MFAKGDRVRIARLIITHKSPGNIQASLACIDEMGKITWNAATDHIFPYHVTMDNKKLGSYYWTEEELEHV